MDIYFCYCDNGVLFASEDEVEVEEFRNSLVNEALEERCEEEGYDIEELEPSKLITLAYLEGYNGDYFGVDKVSIDPDGDYDSETYETDDGYEISISDILDICNMDEDEDDWDEDEDYDYDDEEDDYEYDYDDLDV